MAKVAFNESKMNDTFENSQTVTNPWISDRCLGTVRTVRQLAMASGHLPKVSG